MMKIQKDNTILTVTKGSYEEYYKNLGFKPYVPNIKFDDDKDAIEVPFICKEDKPLKKNKKKSK